MIILTYGGSGATVRTDADAIERLRAIPGVETLDVVKSNRILPINFTYVVGSPLTIDGLEQLGNELAKKQ